MDIQSVGKATTGTWLYKLNYLMDKPCTMGSILMFYMFMESTKSMSHHGYGVHHGVHHGVLNRARVYCVLALPVVKVKDF